MVEVVWRGGGNQVQLPMIPINKGGSIIIQSWNTSNTIPKEIENTNLPIIVDPNKLKQQKNSVLMSHPSLGSHRNININNYGKQVHSQEGGYNKESTIKSDNDYEYGGGGMMRKESEKKNADDFSRIKGFYGGNNINTLNNSNSLHTEIPELERKLLEKQALQKSILNSTEQALSQYNKNSLQEGSLNTALQLYDFNNQSSKGVKKTDRNLPPKKIINGHKNLIDFSIFTEHEQLTDNEFLYCKRVGSHIDYVMCSYKDLSLNKGKLNAVNNKNNLNKLSYHSMSSTSNRSSSPSNSLPSIKTNQNNIEYITISRNTVMHNAKGQITIYGVHEWIDYYIKYKKLLSINLFKYFKPSKIFELWKKLLKSTKKRFYTEKLCLRFHRIDEYLLNGIFKIRRILSNMENYDILKWTINKSVTIFEFQIFNRDHFNEVEAEFKRIRAMVKKEIARACSLSYKQYKDEKKITIEDDQADEDNISDDDESIENLGTKDKLTKKEENQKNFVQNFLKDAMPYAQIATRRTHYKKLLRYIRSVDFIFNESKYNMILNSLKNFYEFLKRLYINNTDFMGFGLFIEVLHPYGNKIVYKPLLEECKKALIDDFIKEKILAVIHKQNFIDPTEFKSYSSCFYEVFEVTVDQNSNFNQRIHDDKEIKELFNKIHEIVEKSFQEIDSFSNSLIPVLKNYNQFSKINFEEQEKISTPEDLKKMLGNFIAEGERISKIKEKVVIGIFEYNLKHLKEMVEFAPTEWLFNIRNLIPKIISTKLMEILKILTDKISMLNVDPNDVKNFITLKVNMEEISIIKQSIEEKSTEIDDIYNIIEQDKEIKLPDYDLKLYRDKKRNMVEFEKKLDNVIYFIDNNLVKYKGELREMTNKFDLAVKKSIEALNREEITRFNEAAKENSTEKAQIALNALSELETDIRNYLKEKNNYHDMESKLDFTKDEMSKFKELSEIEYDYELKKKIWNYINDLQLDIAMLKQEQILKQDLVDLENKIIEYDRTAREGLVDLDVVDVPKALLGNIEELKEVLPILKCFQTKEIKKPNSPYYPEMIKILGLDYSSPEDYNFTVNTITRIPNFKRFTEDLIKIKEKAEKESLILDIHSSINLSFKKINFSFTKHNFASSSNKENKGPDRQVLSKIEIESLYSNIEEKIISLKKIKFSQYSQVKINEINNLLKMYYKILNFLDDYLSLQHYVLLSDEIVYFTDFQLKMPNEFKKFNNEHTMKNLQKLIKDVSANAYKLIDQNGGNIYEQVMNTIKRGIKTYEELFRSVEDYLEKKRQEFWQLYYLSNEELIELLTDNTDLKFVVNSALNYNTENVPISSSQTFNNKAHYISKIYMLFKEIKTNPHEEDFIYITTIFNEKFFFKYTKSKNNIKDLIDEIDKVQEDKIKQTFKNYSAQLKNMLYEREKDKDKEKKKDIKDIILDLIFSKNKEHFGQSIFNCYYSYYYNLIEKILSSNDDIFDRLMTLYLETKERKKFYVDILYGKIFKEDILVLLGKKAKGSTTISSTGGGIPEKLLNKKSVVSSNYGETLKSKKTMLINDENSGSEYTTNIKGFNNTKSSNNKEDRYLSHLEKRLLLLVISVENYFLEINRNLIKDDTVSNVDFNFMKFFSIKVENQYCSIQLFNHKFEYGFEYVGLLENFSMFYQHEKSFLSMFNSICTKKPSLFYSSDSALVYSHINNSIDIVSKLFGKVVIVFNCTNNFDVKAFTRLIYAGQHKGNWLLFDSVEKLPVTTLSVIAQEVMGYYRFLVMNSNKNENNNYENNVDNKLIIHKSTQIFLHANYEKDIKPMNSLSDNILYNPSLREFYHNISLIAPDVQLLIEFSLKNLGVKNTRLFAKKIKYIFNYQNSKLSILNVSTHGFSSNDQCWAEQNESIRIDYGLFSRFYNILVKELTYSKLFSEEEVRIIEETDFQTEEEKKEIKKRGSLLKERNSNLSVINEESNNLLEELTLGNPLLPSLLDIGNIIKMNTGSSLTPNLPTSGNIILKNYVDDITKFNWFNSYVNIAHPQYTQVKTIQLNKWNLQKLKHFQLIRDALFKTFEGMLNKDSENESFKYAIYNVYDSILFDPGFIKFNEADFEGYVDKINVFNIRKKDKEDKSGGGNLNPSSSLSLNPKHAKSSLNNSNHITSKSSIVIDTQTAKLSFLPVISSQKFPFFKSISYSLIPDFEVFLKDIINSSTKHWNFDKSNEEYKNKLFNFFTSINEFQFFVLTGAPLTGKTSLIKDSYFVVKEAYKFLALNFPDFYNYLNNQGSANESNHGFRSSVSNPSIKISHQGSSPISKVFDLVDFKILKPIHVVKIFQKSSDEKFIFEEIIKSNGKQFYNVFINNILKLFSELDFATHGVKDPFHYGTKTFNLSNNNKKGNEIVFDDDPVKMEKINHSLSLKNNATEGAGYNINETSGRNINPFNSPLKKQNQNNEEKERTSTHENLEEKTSNHENKSNFQRSNDRFHQSHINDNNEIYGERKLNMEKIDLDNSHNLVIFDGILDPLITENLNSLKNSCNANTMAMNIHEYSYHNFNKPILNPFMLQDLPSGVSLDLTQYKFVFETPSLRHSNPTQISIMKIFNFTHDCIKEENVLYKFLNSNTKINVNKELHNYVKGLFENFFPKIYEFILMNKLEMINFTSKYVMINMLSLFDSLIKEFDFTDEVIGRKIINRVNKIDQIKKQCLTVFIFCSAWTMSFFSNFILKNKIEKVISDLFKADDMKGPIFDYYIDPETLEFELWNGLIESFDFQINEKQQLKELNELKLDNKFSSLPNIAEEILDPTIIEYLNYGNVYIPHNETFVYIWIMLRILSNVNNNSLNFSTENQLSGITGLGDLRPNKLSVSNMTSDLNNRTEYKRREEKQGTVNMKQSIKELSNEGSKKSINILKNIFYHGKPSQGKSLIIRSLLNFLDNKKYQTINYLNHYNSNPTKISKYLQNNLFHLKRDVLGDMYERKTVFVIDDVNLQKKDGSDNMTSIEYLRQLNEMNSYYCMKTNKYITYDKLSFISVGNISSHQFNECINRMIQSQILISQNDMTQEALVSIYKPRLEGIFKQYIPNTASVTANQYSILAIQLNNIMNGVFHNQPHLKFHLRDITRIFRNFLLVQYKMPAKDEYFEKINPKKPFFEDAVKEGNKDNNSQPKRRDSFLNKGKNGMPDYQDFLKRTILSEIQKQYEDRLIEHDDKDMFKTKLEQIFNNVFKQNIKLEEYLQEEKMTFSSVNLIINNKSISFKDQGGNEGKINVAESSDLGVSNNNLNNNLNNTIPEQDPQEQKKNFPDLILNHERFFYSNINEICNKIVHIYSIYNKKYKDNKNISLFLNEETILHILKLCRFIQEPKGHVSIIANGFSGKHSLINFASFLVQKEVFDVNFSTFDNLNFKNLGNYTGNTTQTNTNKNIIMRYLNNPKLLNIYANSMLFPDSSGILKTFENLKTNKKLSTYGATSTQQTITNPIHQNTPEDSLFSQKRGYVLVFQDSILESDEVLEIIHKSLNSDEIFNSFSFTPDHFQPIGISSYPYMNNNYDLLKRIKDYFYSSASTEGFINFINNYKSKLLSNYDLNLNFVLAIKMGGSVYQQIYKYFPSIYNNTQVFCFKTWDDGVFYDVALNGLNELNNNIAVSGVTINTMDSGSPKNSITNNNINLNSSIKNSNTSAIANNNNELDPSKDKTNNSNINNNNIQTQSISTNQINQNLTLISNDILSNLFIEIKSYFDSLAITLSKRKYLVGYSSNHFINFINSYKKFVKENTEILIKKRNDLINITTSKEKEVQIQNKIKSELDKLLPQYEEAENLYNNQATENSKRQNAKTKLAAELIEAEIPVKKLNNDLKNRQETLQGNLEIAEKDVQININIINKQENKELLDYKNAIETISSPLPKGLIVTFYDLYAKALEAEGKTQQQTHYDWDTIKKGNNLNISVLQYVINLNYKDCPEYMVNIVSEFVNNPEVFAEEKIPKISGNIIKIIRTYMNYFRTLNEFFIQVEQNKGLMNEISEIITNLDNASKKSNGIKEQLESLTEELKVLEKTKADLDSNKQKISVNIEKRNDVLKLNAKINEGLEGNIDEYQEELGLIEFNLTYVQITSLYQAAYIIYASQLSNSYRKSFNKYFSKKFYTFVDPEYLSKIQEESIERKNKKEEKERLIAEAEKEKENNNNTKDDLNSLSKHSGHGNNSKKGMSTNSKKENNNEDNFFNEINKLKSKQQEDIELGVNINKSNEIKDKRLDLMENITFSKVLEILTYKFSSKFKDVYNSLDRLDEYAQENLMILFLNEEFIPILIDNLKLYQHIFKDFYFLKEASKKFCYIAVEENETTATINEFDNVVSTAMKEGHFLCIEQIDYSLYYKIKNLINKKYSDINGKLYCDLDIGNESITKSLNSVSSIIHSNQLTAIGATAVPSTFSLSGTPNPSGNNNSNQNNINGKRLIDTERFKLILIADRINTFSDKDSFFLHNDPSELYYNITKNYNPNNNNKELFTNSNVKHLNSGAGGNIESFSTEDYGTKLLSSKLWSETCQINFNPSSKQLTDIIFKYFCNKFESKMYEKYLRLKKDLLSNESNLFDCQNKIFEFVKSYDYTGSVDKVTSQSSSYSSNPDDKLKKIQPFLSQISKQEHLKETNLHIKEQIEDVMCELNKYRRLAENSCKLYKIFFKMIIYDSSYCFNIMEFCKLIEEMYKPQLTQRHVVEITPRAKKVESNIIKIEENSQLEEKSEKRKRNLNNKSELMQENTNKSGGTSVPKKIAKEKVEQTVFDMAKHFDIKELIKYVYKKKYLLYSIEVRRVLLFNFCLHYLTERGEINEDYKHILDDLFVLIFKKGVINKRITTSFYLNNNNTNNNYTTHQSNYSIAEERVHRMLDMETILGNDINMKGSSLSSKKEEGENYYNNNNEENKMIKEETKEFEDGGNDRINTLNSEKNNTVLNNINKVQINNSGNSNNKKKKLNESPIPAISDYCWTNLIKIHERNNQFLLLLISHMSDQNNTQKWDAYLTENPNNNNLIEENPNTKSQIKLSSKQFLIKNFKFPFVEIETSLSLFDKFVVFCIIKPCYISELFEFFFDKIFQGEIGLHSPILKEVFNNMKNRDLILYLDNEDTFIKEATNYYLEMYPIEVEKKERDNKENEGNLPKDIKDQSKNENNKENQKEKENNNQQSSSNSSGNNIEVLDLKLEYGNSLFDRVDKIMKTGGLVIIKNSNCFNTTKYSQNLHNIFEFIKDTKLFVADSFRILFLSTSNVPINPVYFESCKIMNKERLLGLQFNSLIAKTIPKNTSFKEKLTNIKLEEEFIHELLNRQKNKFYSRKIVIKLIVIHTIIYHALEMNFFSEILCNKQNPGFEYAPINNKDLNSSLKFFYYFLKNLTEKEDYNENQLISEVTGNLYLNIIEYITEVYYLNKQMTKESFISIKKLIGKYLNEDYLMSMDFFFGYESYVRDSYFAYFDEKNKHETDEVNNNNNKVITLSSTDKNPKSLQTTFCLKNITSEVNNNKHNTKQSFGREDINSSKTSSKFVISNKNPLETHDSINNCNTEINHEFALKQLLESHKILNIEESITVSDLKDFFSKIPEYYYLGLLDHAETYSIYSNKYLNSFSLVEKLIQVESLNKHLELNNHEDLTQLTSNQGNMYRNTYSSGINYTQHKYTLTSKQSLVIKGDIQEKLEFIKTNLPEQILTEVEGETIYKLNKFNDYLNPIDESYYYETIMLNRLIKNIIIDLKNFTNSLKNEIKFSDEYKNNLELIKNSKVPVHWAKYYNLSEEFYTSNNSLNKYMKHLSDVYSIFSQPSSESYAFNISYFVNKKLFFYSLRNHFSRAVGKSPEDVELMIYTTDVYHIEDAVCEKERICNSIFSKHFKKCKSNLDNQEYSNSFVFLEGFSIYGAYYDMKKQEITSGHYHKYPLPVILVTCNLEEEEENEDNEEKNTNNNEEEDNNNNNNNENEEYMGAQSQSNIVVQEYVNIPILDNIRYSNQEFSMLGSINMKFDPEFSEDFFIGKNVKIISN